MSVTQKEIVEALLKYGYHGHAYALRNLATRIEREGIAPPDGSWSGWATQFPGKTPQLWGAREIAELNYHGDHGQRLLMVAEVAAPKQDTTCTCPSGDGSLRWPCPAHPNLEVQS